MLLNNQIYLNDELSLYENWKLVIVVVVSVSIWIPVGQLKRWAQETLQSWFVVETARDTKLSGFTQTL